ncbi:MAG: M48 family metallopeptidase [Deltaproteobacteria bacterium]|nr:M48 family metallopeptidase [Deltaproteobacteria bacterium]
MKSAAVAYFDGKVSTRREAVLTLEGDRVTINGDGVDLSYPAASIRVSEKIGSVRRTVRLPDGGVCELDDAALLAELERACGAKTTGNIVHRWEKSLPLALTALVLTALLVALFLRFGIPPLARHAAFALPPAAESSMGREALATLDRLLMKPSNLPKERQNELSALFLRVAGPDGNAAGYRLEFRSCPAIGANAFALPSGIVIITDDLVGLARQDNEIAAILAHELGHVRGRHILRHLLQSSSTALIMATLTGDLLSITSLAATLPTVLVDASYSRAFEREADDAAMAWMKSAGVPPRSYAEILGRLQAQLDVKQGKTAGGTDPVRNYLSTHPDTGERIRRIMKDSGE